MFKHLSEIQNGGEGRLFDIQSGCGGGGVAVVVGMGASDSQPMGSCALSIHVFRPSLSIWTHNFLTPRLVRRPCSDVRHGTTTCYSTHTSSI